MDLIFWASLVALVLYLYFCLMTVLSVNKLTRASELLETRPLSELKNLREHPEYPLYFRWAEEHGFKPDYCGAMFSIVGTSMPLELCTWRNNESCSILAFYVFGTKAYCDLISFFEDQKILTSSNNKDGLMLPSEHYIQAFHGASIGEIKRQHEAAKIVLEKRGMKLKAPAERTQQLILDSIRQQIEYIKALPMWHLEGGVWFLWRRNYLNRKPLMQTIKKSVA